MTLPPNLAALRDQAMTTSCEAWAIQKRWKLGPGQDRAGPCPLCGGEDRFAIHRQKNTFNCRGCGLAGAGVIELVMRTEQVEFTRACEIITGRSASAPVDPEVARQAKQQADADARRRAADAERYREAARTDGYAIWRAGERRYEDTEVAGYLFRRLRAAGMVLPLRFAPSLAYMVQRSTTGRWEAIHRGPAMLAAVQLPDGHFGAVHRTWIDLGQEKGKAVLVHPDSGKALNAKTIRGTKRRGAIRLVTPAGARRLVMGEGIETTLTPFIHNPEPDTAYWAGIDLGHMAGRAARDAAGKIQQSVPDLSDEECFVPPDWVEELVYLAEGDEPAKHPEEKVTRGLIRAQFWREQRRRENPDLKPLDCSYIEPVGAGMDINDLVRVHL